MFSDVVKHFRQNKCKTTNNEENNFDSKLVVKKIHLLLPVFPELSMFGCRVPFLNLHIFQPFDFTLFQFPI